MHRSLCRAFIATALFVLATGQAQAQQQILATSSCNFAGISATYAEGYHRVTKFSGLDLPIASIRVPDRMRVTAYEFPNFSGNSATIAANTEVTCASPKLPFPVRSIIVAHDRPFSMLVASDTQIPWLACNDIKVGTGSPDPCGKITEAEQMRQAVELNQALKRGMITRIGATAEKISSLPYIKPTILGLIINGDLTAFGHIGELDKFRDIWLKMPTKVYLGLGNHDYSNNVNDCRAPVNSCAIQMVELIYDQVSAMDYLSFDAEKTKGYTDARLTTRFKGSMSYSFDIGRVHFVQLHNFPIYTRYFSGYWASRGREYSVDIKASIDWLERDVAAARKRNQVVILNYHNTDDSWAKGYNLDDPLSKMAYKSLLDPFNKILNTYCITAIFAGHYHQTLGEANPIGANGPDYSKQRVFYSGSASQQTFLEVNFSDDTMTVNPKGVTSSAIVNGMPIGFSVFDKPGTAVVPFKLNPVNGAPQTCT